MERMVPLLKSALKSTAQGGYGTPNASPTSSPASNQDIAELSRPPAQSPDPDDGASSSHFVATVDADDSDGSDDDDATSDVETTRHNRAGTTTDRPEDLHDIIEKYWSEITIKSRHWMKSITQWHHGLDDLESGQKKLGILSNRLSIDVTVAPTSHSPTQQTSLINTIESIFPKSKAMDMLHILRENARSLYQTGATDPLLRTLGDFSLTDEAVSKTWEWSFRGVIHCEAQLAYNILQQSPSGHKSLIGISKRCCFCCAILLQSLGVNDGDIVGHGKVYSWTPPGDATEETKQVILEHLKAQFESYLQGQFDRLHRTPDSGSSDDAHDARGPNYNRAMRRRKKKGQ